MRTLVVISFRELVSLAVNCTVLELASFAESLVDRVLRTDHDFLVQQYFIVNTHELFSCSLDRDLAWFYRLGKPQESAVYYSNRKQPREINFYQKEKFFCTFVIKLLIILDKFMNKGAG